MGLFDWVKPKTRKCGPTPTGLYGALPPGAEWMGGPDPAGNPQNFVPEPGSYPFDVTEWNWDSVLLIRAHNKSSGEVAGFSLVFDLSDGTKTDTVEIWTHKGRKGPILEAKQQWVIPMGHPTRELVLVSHGEQTTRVLRKLERCFGYQDEFSHPALPDKTAIICEFVMLRGIVRPDQDYFVARTKVILSDNDGWPYGEFFLNVNSVRKQIWLSEKDTEYRNAILTRISQYST